MVQPTRPTNQCYAVLAVTVLFGVVLYILIPVVMDKTLKDTQCDGKKETKVSSYNNTQTGYVNNTGQDSIVIETDETDELETETELCSWKDYVVYLYWIPIGCLVTLWFALVFCIMCTEYSCYTCCADDQSQTDDACADEKSCLALRAQIWHFQCSRFKSKFNDHPMLSHLDRKDSEDGRLLSYITKYFDRTWRQSSKEKGKKQPKSSNYTLKVRHVYKINNSNVWDKYDGDKSALEDVMHRLSLSAAMEKRKKHRKVLMPQDDRASGQDIKSIRISLCDSQEPVQDQSVDQAHKPVQNQSVDQAHKPVQDQSVDQAQQPLVARESNHDTIVDLSDDDTDDDNDDDTDNDDDINNNNGNEHNDDDISNANTNSDDTNSDDTNSDDTNTNDTDAENDELEGNDNMSSYSIESTPLLSRSWRDIQQYDKMESCMFLLHGTNIENAFSIIEDGFDVNNTTPGYYGKRVHLTESSSKADQYTDSHNYPRDSNLIQFIVRTSLKQAYWRLNNEHVPPSISKNYAALVSGSEKGRRDFRIFQSKNCYPEFLVLYDRIYHNTYWSKRKAKRRKPTLV